MPTLQLKVAPLLNPERYRALAQALTRITAQHLGKREDVTAVVIDDLPAARWYIGGRNVQRATALLEITVTAGTNTVAQKQAFIAAAFAELQEQLGHGQPLEEASYVTVREVPASDWGYGGQSQAARRQKAAQLTPQTVVF
jgi:4-oxalocrotonate tautomerase